MKFKVFYSTSTNVFLLLSSFYVFLTFFILISTFLNIYACIQFILIVSRGSWSVNTKDITHILSLLKCFDSWFCGNGNGREWEWAFGNNMGMGIGVTMHTFREWEWPCGNGRDWEYWKPFPHTSKPQHTCTPSVLSAKRTLRRYELGIQGHSLSFKVVLIGKIQNGVSS